MSSSDTERSSVRAACYSLIVSLLAAVFGGIYEILSHGVWSAFMVYAFLFPLVLETLPACLLALKQRPLPGRWTMQLHHAGVATLTVGSLFEGALAIYGTTNRLTILYWIIGMLLIAAGIVVHLLTRRHIS